MLLCVRLVVTHFIMVTYFINGSLLLGHIVYYICQYFLKIKRVCVININLCYTVISNILQLNESYQMNLISPQYTLKMGQDFLDSLYIINSLISPSLKLKLYVLSKLICIKILSFIL